ncbi:protein S40-5 [Ziziphus jujuba]|uniref:Protein S40-5 n=1 Tax=Ziziphus jujuba TaxID=326968 RepID=A0A6P4ADK6_ZIZJJ|nr:protein S40-5 [Ziziphus jujuba]
MAKGRKLTTSRSERLLGSGAYSYGHSQAESNGTDSSELGEDDIWSSMAVENDGSERGGDHSTASNNGGEWSPLASAAESNGNSIAIRSRRRITRDDRQLGGLSLAFDESGKTASSRIVHQFRGNDSVASSPCGHHMATSAPVNVPDWSKILRVESVESLHELDDGWDDHDSEMVPPHEYLAREYARSGKAAATSVFEGVGRTLKGRDLSRVRDAVWSQTGFDG